MENCHLYNNNFYHTYNNNDIILIITRIISTNYTEQKHFKDNNNIFLGNYKLQNKNEIRHDPLTV